jgi:gas vesicle protein
MRVSQLNPNLDQRFIHPQRNLSLEQNVINGEARNIAQTLARPSTHHQMASGEPGGNIWDNIVKGTEMLSDVAKELLSAIQDTSNTYSDNEEADEAKVSPEEVLKMQAELKEAYEKARETLDKEKQDAIDEALDGDYY